MDPITASALIGTAGSLLQTGGNIASEAIFGKRNQKWTQDNMRLSAELMRQQYDYEREKESPENERRRLEAAGLSSALLYGQGGSPGMASSISSMSSPGASSSGVAPFGNLAKSFSDAALARAQIDNLDQNTAKQKTETDYLRESQSLRLDILSSQALSEKFGAQIKQIDALYQGERNRMTLNKIRTEMDVMLRTLRNSENLTELEKQRVHAYLKSVNGQISLWNEQIKTEGTKQEVNKSTASLNEAKEKTEATEQLLNRAQASLANASKSEVYERMKNYSAQRAKIDAEIDRIGKENKLTDQHIREIKNNIKLRWATFGVNTAKDISSEVRKWINPFSTIADLKKANRGLIDMLDDNEIFFAN